MSDERSDDLDFEVDLEEDEFEVDLEEDFEVNLEEEDDFDVELEEDDFELVERFPTASDGLVTAPGLIPVMEDFEIDLDDDLDEVESDTVFKSIVPAPSDNKKYVEIFKGSMELFASTAKYISSLIQSNGSIDDTAAYDELSYSLNQELRDSKPLFIDTTKVSTISKFVDEGMENHEEFYRKNLMVNDVFDNIQFTEFYNYCNDIKMIKDNFTRNRTSISNKQQELRKQQIYKYLFNDLIDDSIYNVDSNNLPSGLMKSVVLGDNQGKITCNGCEEEFSYEGVLFVIVKDGGNVQIMSSPRICPNCQTLCFLPKNVSDKIFRAFRKRLEFVNTGSRETAMLNIPVYHPSVTELCELVPMFFDRDETVEEIEEVKVNYDGYRLSYLEMYERARVASKCKFINGPSVVAKLLANNYGNYAYLKECATHTFMDVCNKHNFGISEYPAIMDKVLTLYEDYMTPERLAIFEKDYNLYRTDTITTVRDRYRSTANEVDASIEEFKNNLNLLGMIGIDEMIKVDTEALWLHSQNPKLVELTDIVSDYMIINHFSERFMKDYSPRKFNIKKERFMKDTSYSFVRNKIYDLNAPSFHEALAKYFGYFVERGVRIGDNLSSGAKSSVEYSNLIDYLNALYNRKVDTFTQELPSELFGSKDIISLVGCSAEEIDRFFLDNREYFLSCTCSYKFKVPNEYLDYSLGRDVLFSLASLGDLKSIGWLFSMRESIVRMIVDEERYKFKYPKIPYNRVLASNFIDDFEEMNSIDVADVEGLSFNAKLNKLDSTSLMNFFKDCPKLLEIVENLDE